MNSESCSFVSTIKSVLLRVNKLRSLIFSLKVRTLFLLPTQTHFLEHYPVCIGRQGFFISKSRVEGVETQVFWIVLRLYGINFVLLQRERESNI